MNTEEAIRRAARAGELMNDPLIKEGFESIDAHIDLRWRESPLDAADEREELFRLHVAARMFRAFFQTVIDGGKLAKASNPERIT